MSKRTAQANKAILEAWNKERECVQAGKGTRDWTPQQQEDIIKKGKAYDDNGRAFEGQHMKSVEKYPEYQGEAGNIQFLTRAEHLEAHDGNWQNPTNWYFDPITKEKFDFGDGSYKPCKIINLSVPKNVHIEKAIVEEETPKTVAEPQKQLSGNANKHSPTANTHPIQKEKSNAQKLESTKMDGLASIIETIVEFPKKHPTEMKVVKFIAGMTITIGFKSFVNHMISPHSNCENSYNDCRKYKLPHNDPRMKKELSEPLERSSPVEHMVSGHRQRYHCEGGQVEWREKKPYTRGGKKAE